MDTEWNISKQSQKTERRKAMRRHFWMRSKGGKDRSKARSTGSPGDQFTRRASDRLEDRYPSIHAFLGEEDEKQRKDSKK